MSQNKKKMIIIDGNALIHRSFHALPPTMTTKDGEMVNAVYGFASVLIKALREFQPDYAILTLDKEGPTFRHEKYDNYKAQRERAPDDLYQQIPRIKELARAFGLPIYEKQGYEADDLIGTIIEKADQDLEKIIVTGDLDSLQLIDEKTKVYTMSRGLSESVTYDREQVENKFQLKPENMIDYKALRGDPSDNIPGVKGVGEKTATELIKEFGGLDEVYQELEDNPETERIKPKTKELLREHKEEAYLSRDLATIRRDVDIDLDLSESGFKNFKQNKIVELFSELEFKSLLPRINELELRGRDDKQDKFTRNKNDFDYILVDTEEKFRDFLKKIKKQKSFCFDVETTMAPPLLSDLLGVSFSWREGEAYYVYLQGKNTSLDSGRAAGQSDLFNYDQKQESGPRDIDPWLLELSSVFEDEDIKKIGHNIKFDIQVVERAGFEVKGVYFDTMIASYLLNPSSRQHNLDNLVFTELGFEKISKEDLLGKGKDKLGFEDLDRNKLCYYSCEDADFTYRLVSVLEEQLRENSLYDLFQTLEMPLVKVLAQMENNGVKLDPRVLEKLSQRVNKKIRDLEKKIWNLSGTQFNINSPQQLKDILFDKLHISTDHISKTKTGYSTAAAELEKLRDRHEIIPLIQEHREYSKLLNTYIETLPQLINPRTGRVHTSFNQTVTATGRLSSTDPNLQNMPVRTELGRGIRKAFVAERGCKFLSLDYSQIELRLAAHLSGDKKMIQAFKDDQDIHSATAAEIHGVALEKVSKDMRREAKAINFGILYGQGPYGLAQTADIPYNQAKDFIDTYFRVYKKIREFIDGQIDKARKEGYVETMWGRRRYIPEINSQVPTVRSGAERIAINTPLQGSSADMIKQAMIEVHKLLQDKYPDRVKMLIQVHDELLFEVPEELVSEVEQKVKKIMKEVVKLRVPVIVDAEAGYNWSEMEKI